MFRELLQEVVDQTKGGVAALLMGSDGIAVDQYSREQDVVDVESVGLEYSVVLKSAASAAKMLEAGSPEEIVIRTERLTTLVRPLNDDYFVAIALLPEANMGKARFLLRTRSERLLEELD